MLPINNFLINFYIKDSLVDILLDDKDDKE